MWRLCKTRTLQTLLTREPNEDGLSRLFKSGKRWDVATFKGKRGLRSIVPIAYPFLFFYSVLFWNLYSSLMSSEL
ncbi:hypothetical protein Bca52824_028805 [Brassica carinata]|uniref:Uncharacterized protein n=1 Tax=Brassica carinata TaxID=52824 RepID=A0A8X8AS50_BRACI|nr:hypothetical protein Bca52824_028805 [Brassica carinata]